jgi:hypothetical protein
MTAEGILAQTSEPDFKDRVPAAPVSHAQRVMTRADLAFTTGRQMLKLCRRRSDFHRLQ